MELPFSRSEFLEAFAAYNEALWPATVLLWLLSLVVVLAVIRGFNAHRLVTGVLALHWAWAGVAYHFAYFAEINPAAYGFGVLFLVQASLFTGLALRRKSPEYSFSGNSRHIVGALLIAYSFLYPFLAMVLVDPYPGTPTYGVPCPTTLFTIGMVFIATPLRWWYLAIPLVWSFIGGSAAILLKVPLDYALLIGGGSLIVMAIGDGYRRRQIHELS